jgi:hypothetical protein
MNSKKVSSFILGVCTTAVASSLLLTSSAKHHQTTATPIQSQIADGSGPVPPPVQSENMLLADGSGPVPPPVKTKLSLNLLAA